MNKQADSDTPHSGPPWIQPEIQQQIKWRNGDIVISVPGKSGTTWTMNIVYQLLNGGTDNFQDIYAEVPWIEFLTHPEQSFQDVLDRVESMPTDRRRAFKTHSAPPGVPYLNGDSGQDIKYVVVFRNPEEALVSFRPFIDQHSDDWFALWEVSRETMCRPDFSSFYHEIVNAKEMQGMFFGFLAAWWPLRNAQNVLFLHYADMKRDHESAIRKIAGFLGIEPTPGQWQSILEYTSFAWMKQHEDRFEVRTVCKVPPLKSGAMIRQGQIGKAKSDGMTDDISRHLFEVGSRICTDQAALDWYYQGGDLP